MHKHRSNHVTILTPARQPRTESKYPWMDPKRIKQFTNQTKCIIAKSNREHVSQKNASIFVVSTFIHTVVISVWHISIWIAPTHWNTIRLPQIVVLCTAKYVCVVGGVVVRRYFKGSGNNKMITFGKLEVTIIPVRLHTRYGVYRSTVRVTSCNVKVENRPHSLTLQDHNMKYVRLHLVVTTSSFIY